MKLREALSLPGLALALTIGLSGCPQTSTDGPGTTNTPSTEETHEGHDHAHPSEGPHHGDLIELGNEEYHAELLHDDAAGTVTIYVLDGAAAKQVPIEGTEVTINAKHKGSPAQFQLAASPDESDPEGKSSRFESSDPELAASLDKEGAEPRLVLTINGKSYRGEITHSHDHDHEHEHE